MAVNLQLFRTRASSGRIFLVANKRFYISEIIYILIMKFSHRFISDYSSNKVVVNKSWFTVLYYSGKSFNTIYFHTLCIKLNSWLSIYCVSCLNLTESNLRRNGRKIPRLGIFCTLQHATRCT